MKISVDINDREILPLLFKVITPSYDKNFKYQDYEYMFNEMCEDFMDNAHLYNDYDFVIRIRFFNYISSDQMDALAEENEDFRKRWEKLKYKTLEELKNSKNIDPDGI